MSRRRFVIRNGIKWDRWRWYQGKPEELAAPDPQVFIRGAAVKLPEPPPPRAGLPAIRWT